MCLQIVSGTGIGTMDCVSTKHYLRRVFVVRSLSRLSTENGRVEVSCVLTQHLSHRPCGCDYGFTVTAMCLCDVLTVFSKVLNRASGKPSRSGTLPSAPSGGGFRMLVLFWSIDWFGSVPSRSQGADALFVMLVRAWDSDRPRSPKRPYPDRR